MGLTYSGQFEFPVKKFYWCLSTDFTFGEMPDLNDQHRDYIDRDKSFLTGEPFRKLKQTGDDEEKEEEAPAEEEGEGEEGDEKKELDSNISDPEEIKVPPKELTEIDRLKYLVLAIENDCQCSPVGAFKMTAQHQLRRNEAFKGLTCDESLSLGNFSHFRNVQDGRTRKKLDEPSVSFNKKFLESIGKDKPSGCWNFQHDLTKDVVLGRSLLWPGFHFYHVHNQNKFGSVYIGDGLKNLELQFMT